MKRGLQWIVTGAVVWAASAGAQDLQALQKALGEMQKQAAAGSAEVVDFRQLKTILPEKIGALKRENSKGGKNSALGFTISEAEATYRGTDDSSVTIKLSDTAGLGGMGAFAQMGLAADVDNESDTEYEKTYTHKGIRVLEKYNSENKSGEITAMSGNRFTITINVQDGPAALLKTALDAVDLNKLSELKPIPKKE